MTEPIPDLIPKLITTSIPIQNQSWTQSSGAGLKVSSDFKEPNAKVDSDGPEAGWTYVGSTKTGNSKHHSHTTGGNVDHGKGFSNGGNNGYINGTGNGKTVPTIHRRIVATSPASTLAMEEETEELMMEEMIHQMTLQVVKTLPVMIPQMKRMISIYLHHG